MHRYKSFNGPMATTAVQAAVATGTNIKTMLQIATPASRQLQVIAWGFSFDGTPNGGICELIQTDVAATVTAHAASGVQPLDPNAPASLVTLGTAATGYTATAEGTTTASRQFDAQVLGLTGQQYSYQFMPDERPIVAVSKFLRIRIDTSTTTNMLAWVIWDE